MENENSLDAVPTIPTGNPPVPRPETVPAKFWDAETGTIRVDALLKSYLALEKRLSAPADPAVEKARARALLGVPAQAADYCITCDHGLFEPDPDLNERLFAAGFTPEQAQLLYDLAAERLVPLLQEATGEMAAEREMERLLSHFGGPAQWRDQAGAILAWARRNLPAPAVAALAQTADGVLALQRMMAAADGEPRPLTGPGTGAGPDDPARLVADPRYWRDRDPAFIAQATEAFRRVYGG